MSMEQFLADNFPELGEEKIEQVINEIEDDYDYEDDYEEEENEIDWDNLELEIELEETTH